MNIVVTWPKGRSLDSYLQELQRAFDDDEHAFYRVHHVPAVNPGDRCYHVHSGFVRGWVDVVGVVTWTPSDCPVDSVTGQPFRPGNYIEREALWHPLAGVEKMDGFRGWRYR